MEQGEMEHSANKLLHRELYENTTIHDLVLVKKTLLFTFSCLCSFSHRVLVWTTTVIFTLFYLVRETIYFLLRFIPKFSLHLIMAGFLLGLIAVAGLVFALFYLSGIVSMQANIT